MAGVANTESSAACEPSDRRCSFVNFLQSRRDAADPSVLPLRFETALFRRKLQMLVDAQFPQAEIVAVLKEAFPTCSNLLDGVTYLEEFWGHLCVRDHAGRRVSARGQLHLDFQESGSSSVSTSVPATIPIALSPECLLERAWLAYQNNNRAEAVRCYEQVLRKDKPRFDVCFNLGNLHYESRRFEGAVERYKQAIEIRRREPKAWNNLGNALRKIAGCEGEAIDAYEVALELDKEFSMARYNLATLLERLGHRNDARELYRMVADQGRPERYSDLAESRLAELDQVCDPASESGVIAML